jgi:hypothetical protein
LQLYALSGILVRRNSGFKDNRVNFGKFFGKKFMKRSCAAQDN